MPNLAYLLISLVSIITVTTVGMLLSPANQGQIAAVSALAILTLVNQIRVENQQASVAKQVTQVATHLVDTTAKQTEVAEVQDKKLDAMAGKIEEHGDKMDMVVEHTNGLVKELVDAGVLRGVAEEKAREKNP